MRCSFHMPISKGGAPGGSNIDDDSCIHCYLATIHCRRGAPTTIWSDNGTNFVGAANEISSLVQNQAVAHYCSNQGVRWKLFPEQAPNFGGLWEAAVKRFKKHLKVVVGETKLTFD